jgi:putative ABC transport system permease protein
VQLLRLLSWPYIRKHWCRSLLTTAGIALGVVVFVTMHAANASVLYAFTQTIDKIAGKTDLQITAGDTGFGEDILDKVQSVRSVRVAVPVIETVVDPKLPGQGGLYILGIDMTGDRSLRDYDLEDEDSVVNDPLVFLAQPDSVIVSRQFASKNHLKVNDRLRLGTIDGEKVLVVRGIMRSQGVAAAFGGSIAVMDVYATQKIFGRGRTFDRIDLAVKPGVTADQCERDLRAALGPAFEIQSPSARGQQLGAVLAGYSVMANVSSAFALVIGLFIVYNALSIGVVQRRTEIGILRALGATRAQVQGLFLSEGALLGVLGSVLGVAVGAMLAQLVARTVSALVADVYGLSDYAEAAAASPAMFAIAAAAGIATSIAAAIIPCRRAAKVDPVEALQKGKAQVISPDRARFHINVATVFGLLALACAVAPTARAVFYSGYFAMIGAAMIIAPILATRLARLIRPLASWLRPVEGVLAIDSLIQAPRRTAAAVTALMLSIALTVSFGGVARGAYRSITEWMENTLRPDLFVMPTASLDLQAARFPATMAEEIALVPGVRQVQRFRNARVSFQGSPAMIVALEMTSVAASDDRRVVAGDRVDMYRKAAAGEGLIVSDNLAQLRQLSLGQRIEVAAPYGVVQLPIVGIVVDYSDQQGAILMDRAVFTRYWNDNSASDFRVFADPGVGVADLRQRILDHYAGKRQIFVLTNAELKAYIARATNQWFDLTSVQVGIAILVAILGIVNSLTVSIADRRRELGVLRAVGARHGQVRRAIWIEALCVGIIGTIMGGALGAVNLYYLLQVVHRDVVGMRLDFVFPVRIMLSITATVAAAAVLAAIWPAETAVRSSLVEALEYE